MTIKHNQQLQNNHFRKDWQRRVRTHFDQPGKKKSRRTARVVKAARVAPRPVDKLRPVVRCPSLKYNRKVRAGRGFSLQELKAANIPRKLAPTIGISVDPRRKNLSTESLDANVARLKSYRDRLILFPRRNGRVRSGDADKDTLTGAKKGENTLSVLGGVFPVVNEKGVEEAKVEDVEGEEEAYRKLREARSEARLVGVREKRAKQKAEAAEAAKK